jgi:hypothetical protein
MDKFGLKTRESLEMSLGFHLKDWNMKVLYTGLVGDLLNK